MININSNPLILDGKTVANKILAEVKNEIDTLRIEAKRLPGLSVVLVGDNPASHTYVKNKEKTSLALGIHSEIHRLPSEVSEKELIKLICELNTNTNIDGILVQLPLPKHIKTQNIIESILYKKDVDGLHPFNLGNLLSATQECLIPCTPYGVIELLKHYSINIGGTHCVILGRSILVGKPLSMLLLSENATVTIAHSKTPNIEEVARSANILLCAVGKAKLVKKNWVKKDSIIIDIGINRIYEKDLPKLVGDVDFEDVKDHCKAITPVPGGVGPMTIAMLMKNTLKSYKKNINQQ